MATKRSGAKKSAGTGAKKAAGAGAKRSSAPPSRRWSAKVNTEATYPEHDLFNQDAKMVAEHLASRKVSPKGPASGMRMLNFYINRAGKNLSEDRHAELEKAKEILSGIIAQQKGADKKSAVKKVAAKRSAARKSAKAKNHGRKTS